MSASFPSSKKTFSQVINGINKLVALLWNTNYDETEALETYLGASGNAQAKLAALNRLFKYAGSSLPNITWIDNDTIEIAPCCVAMYSSNNYVFKENTTALQIKLSTHLDTGAEASSTWYDVYLIGDGANSQYTAKFVLQGNTPSGATYYKKIGVYRNDGSSNLIRADIVDKILQYMDPQSFSASYSGGITTFVERDLTAVCPTIGLSAVILATDSAAGNTVAIRPSTSSSTTGFFSAYWAAGSANMAMCLGEIAISAGSTYAKALYLANNSGTQTGYISAIKLDLR